MNGTDVATWTRRRFGTLTGAPLLLATATGTRRTAAKAKGNSGNRATTTGRWCADSTRNAPHPTPSAVRIWPSARRPSTTSASHQRRARERGQRLPLAGARAAR
jgi:hypothetical protein